MSDRFWRRKRVSEETGLPASTIYRLMQRGDFPQSVPLAGTTVAWLESEVRDWMEQRIRSRDEALAGGDSASIPEGSAA